MKKVFCRCFLTNLFFETQTNLNSSSSNSNSFYILRSNTIADKCTLVKDLRVNFFNSVSSSPSSFLSQPWRNLYIFISWRYFIPNDWKQIYIWMRLLQNFLISNNTWIFWKVYFWAGNLIYENGRETGKAVDVSSENVICFNFWVSCLYTFNPLPSLLKWVTVLVATTCRNMDRRQSYRIIYMMKIKESERRPFFKFLDGIFFCTIHTRQMKLW